jgi:hypothetical protein
LGNEFVAGGFNVGGVLEAGDGESGGGSFIFISGVAGMGLLFGGLLGSRIHRERYLIYLNSY